MVSVSTQFNICQIETGLIRMAGSERFLKTGFCLIHVASGIIHISLVKNYVLIGLGITDKTLQYTQLYVTFVCLSAPDHRYRIMAYQPSAVAVLEQERVCLIKTLQCFTVLPAGKIAGSQQCLHVVVIDRLRVFFHETEYHVKRACKVIFGRYDRTHVINLFRAHHTGRSL